MHKKLPSMSQYGNSMLQNGVRDTGENKLLETEKIQPEMHLLGSNRGMTKCSAVGAGKT